MKDMRKWEQKKVLQVFLCWWNNADTEEDLYLLSCHLILSGFIDKERWRQKQNVRGKYRSERMRERKKRERERDKENRKWDSRHSERCKIGYCTFVEWVWCHSALLLVYRGCCTIKFSLICVTDVHVSLYFFFSQLQFIPHTFHSLID